MQGEWFEQGDGFVLVYAINDALSFEALDETRTKLIRCKEDVMLIPLKINTLVATIVI